jgi:hypothetical protein
LGSFRYSAMGFPELHCGEDRRSGLPELAEGYWK